jgi:lytic murein transglycosylase
MRILTLIALAFFAFSAMAAAPPDSLRNEIDRQFQAWLRSDVWPEAQARGVTRVTFDRLVGNLRIDWSLPELVLPGSRPNLDGPEIHAEFRSPGAYFNERNIANIVSDGKARIAAHRATLEAIERQFGVRKEILVAFWGRESSFGRERQPSNAISALASQAFLGKRKEVFRPDLIAALEIVQRGLATPEAMRGSWAGALGQPQLMPSDYLRFGVDFDGDGVKDIWNSPADSLATMAGFIRDKGWMSDRGWGLEVKVPASVSCALEGRDKGRPLSEWARLGVTRVDGARLPAKEGAEVHSLLMPAGRFGPAFLVTDNFFVLKSYNNADLYALYVGQVADRLAGGGPFRTAWTTQSNFTRGAVKRMQERLVADGHDVGGADGLVGSKTRVAIGEWQAARKMPATCFPDAAFLARFN